MEDKKKINLKIIIPIVVAIVIIAIVGIVAVMRNTKGVNNNIETSKTNKPLLNKTLSITDKATTNALEFSINKVDYTKTLPRNLLFMSTDKSQADEGNTLVIIEYSVKNIGTTGCSESVMEMKDAQKLIYNEKYTFKPKKAWLIEDNKLEFATGTREPLSNEVIFTAYYEVSEEVSANVDLPLQLEIALSNDSKPNNTSKFIYNLR